MDSTSHLSSSLLSPPLLSFLSSVWQPESETEVGAGGEGTSGGAVKRGLSLESAAAAAGQDVKRFRTATGAASTVSSIQHQSSLRKQPHHPKLTTASSYLQSSCWLLLCSTLVWMNSDENERYFDQKPFLWDKNCQQKMTARWLLLSWSINSIGASHLFHLESHCDLLFLQLQNWMRCLCCKKYLFKLLQWSTVNLWHIQKLIFQKAIFN